ncbi:MAG TPA: methyltransferase domain-containing protein [Anaerolineales bacterium]|nr:methyltransferase domain-containing protein [Anaerolineales bacterium]
MGNKDASKEAWVSGDSYEPYVGRWSRLVAQEFIPWLALPDDCLWLDVGCGTGVLSQTILAMANPKKIKGIDRSESYVEFARSRVSDPRVEFEVGNAQALPLESQTFDAAVSGLVLNFVPQPDQMIAEMARVVRNWGMIALYVWDYAGKMQLMRHFWNAVTALDPGARDLDEGRRFPICNPNSLTTFFQNAGFSQIQVRPIDVSTDFKDFEDYWSPFLGAQGPAPGYAMSLSEERRARLRERLYNSLPFALDGSIPLVARAWAVRGIK